METTPDVTNLETIQKKSAYQALQPVVRPSYWGVDQDVARRPGVPMMNPNPKPMPNTRYPPSRQPTPSSVPLHGRPNKPMPPVYGTTLPLKGLSGLVRTWAYSKPDHESTHWLLMMLGDRVELLEYRAKKVLPWAIPLGLAWWMLRPARQD